MDSEKDPQALEISHCLTRLFKLHGRETEQNLTIFVGGIRSKLNEDISPYLKDWCVIQYIMSHSTLPGLRLVDILENLSTKGADVLKIEPIIRRDLVERFVEEQKMMSQRAGKDEYVWEIASHGTLRMNVPYIIRYGFRLPHTDGYKSRFKLNWGPGIYCSPYATYSYNYGHRWDIGVPHGIILDPDSAVAIFLCAVLRGRSYTCKPEYRQRYTGLQSGYDSHICPLNQEWVVFDDNRIIPLCLLWVKKGVRFGDHVTPTPGAGNDPKYDAWLSNAISVRNYEYQAYRNDMKFT
jgi:Poly(ADP-ribose) polymerase catalytic domain